MKSVGYRKWSKVVQAKKFKRHKVVQVVQPPIGLDHFTMPGFGSEEDRPI